MLTDKKRCLDSLPAEYGLRLRRPIRIIVEPFDADGDNHLARIDGCEICASGDTDAEAVENLGDVIAATFIDLSERTSKLSPRMLAQLEFLRKFITTEDGHDHQ